MPETVEQVRIVQESKCHRKSPDTPWPGEENTDHGVFGDNNSSNDPKERR
jgi:hypothetical protein